MSETHEPDGLGAGHGGGHRTEARHHSLDDRLKVITDAVHPASAIATRVRDSPSFETALARVVGIVHPEGTMPADSARHTVNVMSTVKKLVDLSDDDLGKLMALVKASDSVELKLTVPEAHHRSTVVALGMDPLEAQIRQVFFFDTPGLALNREGIVVRARRVQGRGDDSVVKLRPVVPDELPDRMRRSPGMVVEVDAMPGGWVCSGSLRGSLGAKDVRRVTAGQRAVRKLFSKEQRAFYEAHAPEGLALDDLAILGPIFVLKLNFRPEGYGRKLVAEMWLYPDGSRILELSTKCAPADMLTVAVNSRLFLHERGVDVTGDQHTKTRTALEYFSQHIPAAARADDPVA